MKCSAKCMNEMKNGLEKKMHDAHKIGPHCDKSKDVPPNPCARTVIKKAHKTYRLWLPAYNTHPLIPRSGRMHQDPSLTSLLQCKKVSTLTTTKRSCVLVSDLGP